MCRWGFFYFTLAMDGKRVDRIFPKYVFRCNKDDFNGLNNFILHKGDWRLQVAS